MKNTNPFTLFVVSLLFLIGCVGNPAEDRENHGVGIVSTTTEEPVVSTTLANVHVNPAINLTCFDSDGNDTLVSGYVSGIIRGQKFNWSDFCNIYGEVIERTCISPEDGSVTIYMKTHKCQPGYSCLEGACVMNSSGQKP